VQRSTYSVETLHVPPFQIDDAGPLAPVPSRFLPTSITDIRCFAQVDNPHLTTTTGTPYPGQAGSSRGCGVPVDIPWDLCCRIWWSAGVWFSAIVVGLREGAVYSPQNHSKHPRAPELDLAHFQYDEELEGGP
jgi:hypothetical protein